MKKNSKKIILNSTAIAFISSLPIIYHCTQTRSSQENIGNYEASKEIKIEKNEDSYVQEDWQLTKFNNKIVKGKIDKSLMLELNNINLTQKNTVNFSSKLKKNSNYMTYKNNEFSDVDSKENGSDIFTNERSLKYNLQETINPSSLKNIKFDFSAGENSGSNIKEQEEVKIRKNMDSSYLHLSSKLYLKPEENSFFKNQKNQTFFQGVYKWVAKRRKFGTSTHPSAYTDLSSGSEITLISTKQKINNEYLNWEEGKHLDLYNPNTYNKKIILNNLQNYALNSSKEKFINQNLTLPEIKINLNSNNINNEYFKLEILNNLSFEKYESKIYMDKIFYDKTGSTPQYGKISQIEGDFTSNINNFNFENKNNIRIKDVDPAILFTIDKNSFSENINEASNKGVPVNDNLQNKMIPSLSFKFNEELINAFKALKFYKNCILLLENYRDNWDIYTNGSGISNNLKGDILNLINSTIRKTQKGEISLLGVQKILKFLDKDFNANNFGLIGQKIDTSYNTKENLDILHKFLSKENVSEEKNILEKYGIFIDKISYKDWDYFYDIFIPAVLSNKISADIIRNGDNFNSEVIYENGEFNKIEFKKSGDNKNFNSSIKVKNFVLDNSNNYIFSMKNDKTNQNERVSEIEVSNTALKEAFLKINKDLKIQKKDSLGFGSELNNDGFLFNINWNPNYKNLKLNEKVLTIKNKSLKSNFSNLNSFVEKTNSTINPNNFISIPDYLVVEANQSFANEYALKTDQDFFDLLRKTLASPLIGVDLAIPKNVEEQKANIQKVFDNNFVGENRLSPPYTEKNLKQKFENVDVGKKSFTEAYPTWLDKVPTQDMLDSITNNNKLTSSTYRLLVGLMNANMSPKELVPNDYAGSFYVEATYNNIDPTNFTPEYGFYELERKARKDNNGYDYTYLVRINSSKVKFDIKNDTKVDTELLTLMENRQKVNSFENSFENSLDFLNNFLNDKNNKLSQLLKNLELKNQIGNSEKPSLEAFKDENGKYYIDISYKTAYQNKRLNTRPFNNGTTILTPLEIDKILGNKLKILLNRLWYKKNRPNDNFNEDGTEWEQLLSKKDLENEKNSTKKSIIRIPFEYFFEEVETNFSNWFKISISINENIYPKNNKKISIKEAKKYGINIVENNLSKFLESIQISDSNVLEGSAKIIFNFKNGNKSKILSISSVEGFRKFNEEVLWKNLQIDEDNYIQEDVILEKNWKSQISNYGINFSDEETKNIITKLKISESDIWNGNATIDITIDSKDSKTYSKSVSGWKKASEIKTSNFISANKAFYPENISNFTNLSKVEILNSEIDSKLKGRIEIKISESNVLEGSAKIIARFKNNDEKTFEEWEMQISGFRKFKDLNNYISISNKKYVENVVLKNYSINQISNYGINFNSNLDEETKDKITELKISESDFLLGKAKISIIINGETISQNFSGWKSFSNFSDFEWLKPTGKIYPQNTNNISLENLDKYGLLVATEEEVKAKISNFTIKNADFEKGSAKIIFNFKNNDLTNSEFSKEIFGFKQMSEFKNLDWLNVSETFPKNGVFTLEEAKNNKFIFNNEIDDFVSNQIKTLEITNADFEKGSANVKVVLKNNNSYSKDFNTFKKISDFKSLNWLKASKDFYAINGKYVNVENSGIVFSNLEAKKALTNIEITNSDIVNGSATIKLNFNSDISSIIGNDFDFDKSFTLTGFKTFDSSLMKYKINNQIKPENVVIEKGSKSLDQFKEEIISKGINIESSDFLSKMKKIQIIEADQEKGSAKLLITWKLSNIFSSKNSNEINAKENNKANLESNAFINTSVELTEDMGTIKGFDYLKPNVGAIIGSVLAGVAIIGAAGGFTIYRIHKKNKLFKKTGGKK